MRARGGIRAGWCALYYLSWVWFALFGLILNLACLPLLAPPPSPRTGPMVRAVIRRLFGWWTWWCGTCRILRVSWDNGGRELTPGTVYIANHPTLVDATFLLARLPDTVCIIKPALTRHPAIGAAAAAAGHVAGDFGTDVMRTVGERVAAGSSVLIFPEGTRTAEGLKVGPIKPGFALIAGRAHAPVQLLLIRASPGLVRRGRAWWKPPVVLPGWWGVTMDRRWEYDPTRTNAALTAEVGDRLCEALQDSP